jgi:hypothetical protein
VERGQGRCSTSKSKSLKVLASHQTFDLETDEPLKPDEDALGVSYEDIDDFPGREDHPAHCIGSAFWTPISAPPTSGHCLSLRDQGSG